MCTTSKLTYESILPPNAILCASSIFSYLQLSCPFGKNLSLSKWHKQKW